MIEREIEPKIDEPFEYIEKVQLIGPPCAALARHGIAMPIFAATRQAGTS